MCQDLCLNILHMPYHLVLKVNIRGSHYYYHPYFTQWGGSKDIKVMMGKIYFEVLIDNFLL